MWLNYFCSKRVALKDIESQHSEACLMQSTFLRWRQASSDAVRERAFGAQHNAAAVAVAAQAQRSKAALHSAPCRLQIRMLEILVFFSCLANA